MGEQRFPVLPRVAEKAHITKESYASKYHHSVEDSESFWQNEASKRLDWIRPFSIIRSGSYADPDVTIKWFEDGQLNVAANCLDRHLADKGDTQAIIWEGDAPGESRTITYKELHQQVCAFANGLISLGVTKGDVVTIYMPMVPEATVVMLACARIGAVHSVIFGGFSPDAIAGRIRDSHSRVVVTADEGPRGGKMIPLKENVDKALEQVDIVDSLVVLQRTGGNVSWQEGRDIWFHELSEACAGDNQPATVGAEDPLFILYTSGSTGTPKGLQHTSGGYLTYANMTFEYIFDYKPGQVYWCTADVGWITGHSYIVYGPLSNGATVLMFEGVPNYPDFTRWGQIIEKHKVNIFYTAPTAIRSLMAQGEDVFGDCNLDSLELLGSVGEPINPEAWHWYHKVIGKTQLPIVDTWWQTETGGIMIAPLPGATDLKPGSATLPFFGVQPALVDAEGTLLEGEADGNLVILDSWPGQGRSIWGNHQRFIETYFSTYPGYYFTGDGAKRDKDGYFWITGRVDDVLNVSGHRLGTAEVESALVEHEHVAEAAVVGYPHDIKGQGVYAYVTLVKDCPIAADDVLRKELVALVRRRIGPIALIDKLQWAPNLPKTRSGKIMRRILRKIATDELDQFGDTSTLADPSVIDELIDNHKLLP